MARQFSDGQLCYCSARPPQLAESHEKAFTGRAGGHRESCVMEDWRPLNWGRRRRRGYALAVDGVRQVRACVTL
jgi:hypothetical protein